jgi:threonylcarbamoyladenosine tRNA methylthiotransferase MtaB
MSGQVPVQIARERNRVLRELAANKKLSFMRNFIGASISAITLNVHDGEYTETLTDNYLKLRVLGSLQPNQWITGRVEEVKKGFLVGRVLRKSDTPIGVAHAKALTQC